MSVQLKDRKIPQEPARIRAELVPSSFDKEKRTIKLSWGTGKKGLRWTYGIGWFYEELSMDPAHCDMSRLSSGNSPFMDNHGFGNPAVLGRILSANTDGTLGDAEVSLVDPDSLRNDDAADTIKKIESGHIVNTSVGYQVTRYERQPDVEGEDIPTYRAVKWQPKEVSAVPVGFDDTGVIRSASDKDAEPCEFINNLPDKRNEEASNMDVNVKQEQERAAAEKQKQQADQLAEQNRVKDEAIAAERARAGEITALAKRHNLDPDFTKRMIDEGKSLDHVREAILEKLAVKTDATEIRTARVEAGAQDETVTRREAITDAIMHRAHPEAFKVTDKSREFVGMSLIRMAEECLGRSARGMGPGQLVSRALSSSDFPLILANVGEKMLMAAYQIQARQYELITARGTLRDYKAQKRYQIGDAPALLEVKEGGEYQAGAFGEKAESVQLVDYGRLIKFTRQMIINDDVQAFQRVIGAFGGAGARKIEALVFAILDGNPTMADNIALFHANHGNLGTASAINEAGVGAMEALFLNQKTLDGEEYLNIVAKFLFCGTAKKLEAQKLLASVTSTKSGDVNPYQNAYQLIVNPRISGNKWGLLADPAVLPTIEVSYLDGETGPVIDSKEDFDTDGVNFKCRQTASVKAIEWKGVNRNPGA